jgi:hypothetical protein
MEKLSRPQPDRRFEDKLKEQLGFLKRSCQAFDQGHEEEALRIATSLRVIFHQTDKSTSLVSHLGLADSQMLSSSRGHGDYKDFLRYALNLASPTPIRALPMLGTAFHKISVNQWWKHEPVFVHEGKAHARRRIILSAANKDGGAHVDKDLEDYYEALCSGQFAFGITGDLKFSGPEPYPQGVTQYAPNGHLALLRQFGHETLASAKQFRWAD